MGMVLYNELTASYAAGSLGGTLGRLKDSLRRLSLSDIEYQPQAGECDMICRYTEADKIAYLNQTLRLMTDAWHSNRTASHLFNIIDRHLMLLKERALDCSCGCVNERAKSHNTSDYHLLAQSLYNLKLQMRLWC